MSDTPILRALIEELREDAHYLSIAPKEEGADRDWFKAQCEAYDKVLALLSPAEARVPSERPHEQNDDHARSPSLDSASATGSPRSTPTKGSQR